MENHFFATQYNTQHASISYPASTPIIANHYHHQPQHHVYKSELSTSSNWSYLSNSSGFESQSDLFDLTHDFELGSLGSQNQQVQTVSEPEAVEINMEAENSMGTGSSEHKPLPIVVTFMWQFLLELLENPVCRDVICWSVDSSTSSSSPSSSSCCSTTDNQFYNDEREFVLIDGVETARRWSARSAKANMTYTKFKRTLRYYCKKNIVKKTPGKLHTYSFHIDIQPYLNQIHLFKSYQHQQLQQQQHHQQHMLVATHAPFLFA